MMQPGVPSSDNALSTWQRRTVLGAAGSLLLSGVIWWLVSRLGRDGAGELPHPAEPWLARWHALSAAAGTFAAGLVAAHHIGLGLRLGRRRGTGGAVALLGLVLILTGFALAYLVPEGWHPLLGTTHAGLGLVVVALLLAHRRGVDDAPP